MDHNRKKKRAIRYCERRENMGRKEKIFDVCYML